MSIEYQSPKGVRIPVRQLKAARALLGWSQADLADHSGVSEPTIARLEAEDGLLSGRPETTAKIVAALSKAGISLAPDAVGGWCVRLSERAAKSVLGYDLKPAPDRKRTKSEHGHDFAPVQSRMARVALGWGVRDLADAAGVSADTVARLERGEQLKDSTLSALRAAFEAAGIEFIAENGGGPGVRAPRRKG